MKGQSQSASERGQGAVEFILLLLASFTVLALLRQFNDGFRNYVSNYYGAYLTCLLETGELPSLGFEGVAGSCADDFKPFTLAGGRPPINPENALGASGNSNGDTNDGNANGDKKKDAASASASALAKASAGGGGGGGNDSGGPSLLADDAEGGRRVPLSKADGGGGKTGSSFNGVSGYDNGADRGDGRTQFVPAGIKEASDSVTDLRKANVPAPAEDAETSTNRVPADVIKKKPAAAADDALTLPDFIKILLIVGLIILMLVFFGGQALQISKGGDK